MAEAQAAFALDETDRAILRSLNESARKSYRDVARELGIALSTVSARVRRLEDERVIKGYIPLVDSARLGYDLVVAISVKIAHGKLIEVQSKISKRPEVFGVYDVTGEFDSLILARFRSRSELNDFVKEVLALGDVEHTTTHLVLNTIKEEARFLL